MINRNYAELPRKKLLTLREYFLDDERKAYTPQHAIFSSMQAKRIGDELEIRNEHRKKGHK